MDCNKIPPNCQKINRDCFVKCGKCGAYTKELKQGKCALCAAKEGDRYEKAD